jgi:hypothetical protein
MSSFDYEFDLTMTLTLTVSSHKFFAYTSPPPCLIYSFCGRGKYENDEWIGDEMKKMKASASASCICFAVLI